jgi:DNA adenine methylase
MGGLGVGGPSRPLVRYHGGKWRLAPWIISHFPRHRIYVEPFGGGASVLLRKARSYAEVYNDLDGEIVNLFRVVRDRGEELRAKLELTPFAREEFETGYEPTECELERARRTLVRSHMGFGTAQMRMTSAGAMQSTGFRGTTKRAGTVPAHDWRGMPSVVRDVVERMRGVVIEQLDAATVMRKNDGPETLRYVDPPYVHATRSGACEGNLRVYRHELSDEDHEQLAAVLRGLQGRVVVSGYPCTLYERLYQGWARVEKRAMADGARERVEVLWMNFEVEGMLL